MKKKKNMIGWAIVLLIIIYFSAVVMNLASDNSDIRANAFLYASINFGISSVIMMLEPFIWRLANKDKLPLEKGKRICSSNSICLFIISACLYAVFKISFIGGIGAILYYFINKWLFVDLDGDSEVYHWYECGNCGELVSKADKKCPKCKLTFDNKINSKIRKESDDIGINKKEKSEQKKDEDDNYERIEEEPNEEKTNKEKLKNRDAKEVLVCSNCGNIISSSDTKCKKCGEKLIEEKEEKIKIGIINKKQSKTSLDQKYSDLKKLKELLDEGIITKEEFEKEKEKIMSE